MIAATLCGGLGNQMFIYAAVRATSLRNNTSMAFNLKQGFKDDRLFQRNLELTHFQLDLPESSCATFDVPLGKVVRYISRKIGCNLLKPSMQFLRENVTDKDLIKRASNAYLEGYFGDITFFSDFSDEIKNDFAIKEQYISIQVREELHAIRNYERPIVMIGVRRYQECKSVKLIPHEGAKETPDYFRSAMKYVTEKIKNPIFWVFSQQQEWFKENVDDGTYDIVYANPKCGADSAIEDMYLMTQCDHFIITQSTYYWWAAWLSRNANKLVVCPSTNGSRINEWTYL